MLYKGGKEEGRRTLAVEAILAPLADVDVSIWPRQGSVALLAA